MSPITTASDRIPNGVSGDRWIDTAKLSGILTPLGRVVFGIPMVVFGIQHFIYVRFVTGLVPAWMPGRGFWTYFTGVALITAGTAIILGKMARLAAGLLGLMVFLFFLLVHVPLVAASPSDPSQWTYMIQAFTFSGMALVVASAMRSQDSWAPIDVPSGLLGLGRWFVAIGFLVLGGRQLLGIPFVLRIVPAWYPGQSFWALVSGFFLIATSAGIILKRERVPAMLLGAVLLLFVVGAHMPALVARLGTGDWAPACKGAILCGGTFLLAAGRPTRNH